MCREPYFFAITLFLYLYRKNSYIFCSVYRLLGIFYTKGVYKRMFLISAVITMILGIVCNFYAQTYAVPYKGLKASDVIDMFLFSNSPTVQLASGAIIQQQSRFGLDGVLLPLMLFLCSLILLALTFVFLLKYYIGSNLTSVQTLLAFLTAAAWCISVAYTLLVSIYFLFPFLVFLLLFGFLLGAQFPNKSSH